MKRNELGGKERQKSTGRLSVIKVLEGSVGSRCYFGGVSKCSGVEMGARKSSISILRSIVVKCLLLSQESLTDKD